MESRRLSLAKIFHEWREAHGMENRARHQRRLIRISIRIIGGRVGKRRRLLRSLRIRILGEICPIFLRGLGLRLLLIATGKKSLILSPVLRLLLYKELARSSVRRSIRKKGLRRLSVSLWLVDGRGVAERCLCGDKGQSTSFTYCERIKFFGLVAFTFVDF